MLFYKTLPERAEEKTEVWKHNRFTLGTSHFFLLYRFFSTKTDGFTLQVYKIHVHLCVTPKGCHVHLEEIRRGNTNVNRGMSDFLWYKCQRFHCIHLVSIWQTFDKYASIELFSQWDVYFIPVTPNCSFFLSSWHIFSNGLDLCSTCLLVAHGIICHSCCNLWTCILRFSVIQSGSCGLNIVLWNYFPIRFCKANCAMYSLAFKLLCSHKWARIEPHDILKGSNYRV